MQQHILYKYYYQDSCSVWEFIRICLSARNFVQRVFSEMAEAAKREQTLITYSRNFSSAKPQANFWRPPSEKSADLRASSKMLIDTKKAFDTHSLGVTFA
jgi:hypothetical protein